MGQNKKKVVYYNNLEIWNSIKKFFNKCFIVCKKMTNDDTIKKMMTRQEIDDD